MVLAAVTVGALSHVGHEIKSAEKQQQGIPELDEKGHGHEHGSSMKRVFAVLFPFASPAWNSSEL